MVTWWWHGDARRISAHILIKMEFSDEGIHSHNPSKNNFLKTVNNNVKRKSAEDLRESPLKPIRKEILPSKIWTLITILAVFTKTCIGSPKSVFSCTCWHFGHLGPPYILLKSKPTEEKKIFNFSICKEEWHSWFLVLRQYEQQVTEFIDTVRNFFVSSLPCTLCIIHFV